MAHIVDISESGVTRVTWGLWQGQDLQQVTLNVAFVAPSAPAPGRTHVLPLGLGTVSKVPAQAQPLAAAFTGSVTHLSGQGGAQGDEFGDGPEDQAPQLPHPKLPLIQTSVSWPQWAPEGLRTHPGPRPGR